MLSTINSAEGTSVGTEFQWARSDSTLMKTHWSRRSCEVFEPVALHRQYIEQNLVHAGILVVPDQRCSTGEKIRRVARFVRSVTAEDMVNRMEYL
jgi:hypothetical protein